LSPETSGKIDDLRALSAEREKAARFAFIALMNEPMLCGVLLSNTRPMARIKLVCRARSVVFQKKAFSFIWSLIAYDLPATA
jgi:hypothetical protein